MDEDSAPRWSGLSDQAITWLKATLARSLLSRRKPFPDALRRCRLCPATPRPRERGMSSVGILAYGSLIEDPGQEIAAAKARIEPNVETPFKVEFARTSSTRAGAPTLVPVMTGGGHVPAQIIVLKNTISED